MTPVHLCGKFLVSALAKYFIHESKNNKLYLLENILFFHILKSFDNEKTKKRKQIENIKKNIWKELLTCNSSNLSVSEYEVIWSDNEDLEREILEKIEDI